MNDKYDSITENILKQYEEKICCATCKWLGIFTTLNDRKYFTCRIDKEMDEALLDFCCKDYKKDNQI